MKRLDYEIIDYIYGYVYAVLGSSFRIYYLDKSDPSLTLLGIYQLKASLSCVIAAPADTPTCFPADDGPMGRALLAQK